MLEDACGRIFAVLAGKPTGDPTWINEVEPEVDEVLVQAEAEVRTTTCKTCKGPAWKDRCADCRNWRGDFKCLNVGVSFGNGRTVSFLFLLSSPLYLIIIQALGNLSNTPRNQRIASRIIQSKSIQQLSGFINGAALFFSSFAEVHLTSSLSGAFAWYAPKLYRQYAIATEKIYNNQPHLQRIFTNSVFPAAAFNLGPQVATLEHADGTNLPFGWCAVYASGNFDPKRGGHLILRDLGLMIEFPPGSVVFLPSGTLLHGNTALQNHETRRSFTQYATGGLFRWVYYGFRTEGDMAAMDKERAVHSKKSAPTRIQEAIGLFSTVDSLHKDRVALAL